MRPRPGRRARHRHRIAHAFGLRAERIAAAWLLLKGYRILARRYAVAGGEIDLVALRRDVVAFVEVKARGSLESALDTISPTKRRRIERAVRHWLVRNPWAVGRVLRADAIFIAPWRRPRHLENAFELQI